MRKDVIVVLLAGGLTLTEMGCKVFKNPSQTATEKQKTRNVDVDIYTPAFEDGTSKIRDQLCKKIIAALKDYDLVVTLTENGSPEAMQTLRNLGIAANDYVEDAAGKKIKIIAVRSENKPKLAGGDNGVPSKFEVGFYNKNSLGKKNVLNGHIESGDYKVPGDLKSADDYLEIIEDQMPGVIKSASPHPEVRR
jgi:hypothetical protein